MESVLRRKTHDLIIGYYMKIQISLSATRLKSVTVAKALAHKMAAAAQKEYDDWDESNRDEYAGGGICHRIAEAICSILDHAGIGQVTTVSSDHEQHVYVAAAFKEGVFSIDIHWSLYETGGGFSWKKLPDVEFDQRDITFYKISSDPKEFANYLDE